MFVTVAIHHPKREHADEFLAFMHRVQDMVADAPGLIEFRSWRDTSSDRLVGMARWESEDAFRAALPQVMSLSHDRKDEWSERPDDLLTLTEA